MKAVLGQIKLVKVVKPPPIVEKPVTVKYVGR